MHSVFKKIVSRVGVSWYCFVPNPLPLLYVFLCSIVRDVAEAFALDE